MRAHQVSIKYVGGPCLKAVRREIVGSTVWTREPMGWHSTGERIAKWQFIDKTIPACCSSLAISDRRKLGHYCMVLKHHEDRLQPEFTDCNSE